MKNITIKVSDSEYEAICKYRDYLVKQNTAARFLSPTGVAHGILYDQLCRLCKLAKIPLPVASDKRDEGRLNEADTVMSSTIIDEDVNKRLCS